MKRNEIILQPEFVGRVAALYRDMEAAYDQTAEALEFSCAGCPDNCCDSYFLHHTYTEWAYLWHGLRDLEESRLQATIARAAAWVAQSETAQAQGERPLIMCPLNVEGRCSMYPYRLMICRLHGVPATFRRPDGRKLDFPGCFRCQEHVAAGNYSAPLERTRFFRRLVDLEIELLGPGRMSAPKVKMSIARMIVEGAPALG